MHITTTARHCELDNEDRRFVEQRLEKLGRFARDVTEVHVTVTAEKYRHAAEITVKLRRTEFVSREEAGDLRTAVDQAVDRMEHQIRRHKERRVERKSGGRAKTTDGASAGTAETAEVVDEEGEYEEEAG